ncbi:hypothetical protein GN330_17625 [Nitratireductor sp. CAU 1489]|uniref:Uncharacterized protein n=1 Tax=Nitratireductor arenosus TaxID=2682096 RepID=A0A844QMI3_9HYPH|nr:hypothetical protein [Nitratireductor arenosus]MVA99071.1 hypothetical protein [Nitratireductor arenosus]
MMLIATLAFVLGCGLTLAGLAGSLMELWAGRRLDLRDPFVSPRHLARSLLLTVLAGPFMLLNEMLRAVGEGRRGVGAIVPGTALATIWLAATGTIVAELAFHAAALFS